MTPDQVSDWKREALIDSKRMELERAVVDAAKACRIHDSTGFHNNMEVEEYEVAMSKYDTLEAAYNKAIDALIEFESEHGLMTLERK